MDTAPIVYCEYSTKKFLDMELLNGVSLLDTDSIVSITDNNPGKVISSALNVWTQSVMSMPWFRSDGKIIQKFDTMSKAHVQFSTRREFISIKRWLCRI